MSVILLLGYAHCRVSVACLILRYFETCANGNLAKRFMDESFQRIEVEYACTDTTRG